MKSILIIGMGMLGEQLAMKMQELGNDVMIVDDDEDRIQELSSRFNNSFAGDCTNIEVLKSLGVNNYDYCFVAIGEDSYASLEITSLLKELGAKKVVSKASRVRQAEFLKKLGADEVFFPEKEIAEKLAIRYNSSSIFDYSELSSEYSVFEIAIIPEWTGKNIMEINVRQKYNVNIIAIKKGTAIDPLPGGDYIFDKDDHIIVIGKPSDVFRLTSKTDR